MTKGMRAFAVALALALIGAVGGSASVLARPPLGKAASGFIANEGPIPGGASSAKSPAAAAATETPSFVSVGIRSGCAREKAATATRDKEPSASAASRLRGGSSWIPHPPVKLSRADLEHSHAKVISNSNPVSSHRPTEGSSCHRKSGDGTNSNAHGGDGAELTVSRQRLVVTDEDVDPLPSFADEDVGAAAAAAAGSGGGGGGRVGTFSLPRALPAATNGKAPLNKKFAWVP